MPNAMHNSINAVTHELKMPVPSIRLYLETLQPHGDGRSLKPGELTFYVDQTDGIASPSRRWSLTRESQKLPCVTIRNARCVSDAHDLRRISSFVVALA